MPKVCFIHLALLSCHELFIKTFRVGEEGADSVCLLSVMPLRRVRFGSSFQLLTLF